MQPGRRRASPSSGAAAGAADRIAVVPPARHVVERAAPPDRTSARASPATAPLIRRAPSEPPKAARVHRSAGEAERGRASRCPAPDRSTEPISGRTGVPVTCGPRQVGSREGDRAGGGEPAEERVDRAGDGVGVDQDERHPGQHAQHTRPGSRRTRRPRRRPGAGGPGTTGPTRTRGPEQAERPRRALAHRAPGRKLRRMPRPGRSVKGNSSAGHTVASWPRRDPKSSIERPVPALHQGPGDLQRGHDVAAGPAAGDHGETSTAHRPRAAGQAARARPARLPVRQVQHAVHWALPLLAGDVDQDPGRRHGDDERRPSERDEGQRDPGHRQDAHHGADIDQRLAGQPGHQADGEQAAETVAATAWRPGCRTRRRRPSRTRTRAAPMKPSSSPMTEKMKSVWALGRKPHSAWPPPRPAPKRWPEPRPISDCTTW